MNRIAVMNRARLLKRQTRDAAIRQESQKLFEKYKNDPLFLSGVILYWAEGTRLSRDYRRCQLAFTNSDPGLVSFYCRFLEKYFRRINRNDWRIELFLYPDISISETTSYWSRLLNISPRQFIKPQILPGNGNKRNNIKLKFGVCCVYVNSKDACLAMHSWIESVANTMRR